MSPEENKKLVQRAFDEFINKKNLAAAPQYLTPNYVGHFTGAPPVEGVNAFQQYLQMWQTAMPDSKVTIDDIFAEGDRVVVRATFRGTHTGPLMGIQPTGKPVVVTSINVFRVVDGKTAEQWANNDDLGMLQQIGVVSAMQPTR